MALRLRTPPEYNLMASVHAWVFPDVQPVPEVTSGRSLVRVFTVDGTDTPVSIHQSKAGADLRVAYIEEHVSRSEIRSKLKHVLGFDIDMRPVHRLIETDPVLRRLDRAIFGVRPYLSDTPFEALVKSIIQQQISYRVANLITRKLVLDFDICFDIGQMKAYHFPSAKLMSQRQEEQLRLLGLGQKARTIRTVAQMVTSGELCLEDLLGRPYEEVASVLIPIRGIGPWTVQAMCIAGLGHFAVFPYGDLGIRNLLGRLYLGGERMSTKAVRALADSWGEAGTLVLYLLMCADVLGLVDASRHTVSKTHKRLREQRRR